MTARVRVKLGTKHHEIIRAAMTICNEINIEEFVARAAAVYAAELVLAKLQNPKQETNNADKS